MAVVTCAHCRASVEPIPILFGYPTAEAMEAARRGELVIGGCVVMGGEPEFVCPRCAMPLEGADSRADGLLDPLP